VTRATSAHKHQTQHTRTERRWRCYAPPTSHEQRRAYQRVARSLAYQQHQSYPPPSALPLKPHLARARRAPELRAAAQRRDVTQAGANIDISQRAGTAVSYQQSDAAERARSEIQRIRGMAARRALPLVCATQKNQSRSGRARHGERHGRSGGDIISRISRGKASAASTCVTGSGNRTQATLPIPHHVGSVWGIDENQKDARRQHPCSQAGRSSRHSARAASHGHGDQQHLATHLCAQRCRRLPGTRSDGRGSSASPNGCNVLPHILPAALTRCLDLTSVRWAKAAERGRRKKEAGRTGYTRPRYPHLRTPLYRAPLRRCAHAHCTRARVSILGV